jgi:ribonucleoside-diphosphate reductase beta chain
MYALARAGKMLGSAQMIRFIQRDEVTHLLLFQNIFNVMKKELPHAYNERVAQNCSDMLKEAAELEMQWGKYIVQGGVMGLSPSTIEEFVKYLANKRAKGIGVPIPFPEAPNENPIRWFDSFSKLNDHKTNFFEGNVTNYSKGVDFNF